MITIGMRRLHDDLVAHLRGKGGSSNQAREDRDSVHRGRKTGNFVKATRRGPRESVGRELLTTHRVVMYAMVITVAAVAAAANPLRSPCHSSYSFSLSFTLVSPSYIFLHTLVLSPDDCLPLYSSSPIDFARFSLVPIYPSLPPKAEEVTGYLAAVDRNLCSLL